MPKQTNHGMKAFHFPSATATFFIKRYSKFTQRYLGHRPEISKSVIPMPREGYHAFPFSYRGVTLFTFALNPFNSLLINQITPNLTQSLQWSHNADFEKGTGTTPYMHAIYGELLQKSRLISIKASNELQILSKAFYFVKRKVTPHIPCTCGILYNGQSKLLP